MHTHIQIYTYIYICIYLRWCEGTLGVKKSTEETVGIALN